MNDTDFSEILREDARRRALLSSHYDPVVGTGCCGTRLTATAPDGSSALIPQPMAADTAYEAACGGLMAWRRLRIRHDFEYWAATCVRVKDKLSGRDVPFILNRPQRRMLAMLERQRLAGEPIRLIMLKARQWGGSTLIQMYMAWIQLVHRRNWHSLICAHVKQTAAVIRAMYGKLLAYYPDDAWTEADEPNPRRMKAFAGSADTRVIPGRECRVTLGSAESEDAVRGADYAMAHLSEVAFWRSTPGGTPEDFIRAVCGSVAREPLTLIVLESTANGTGNYFHTEWLRACGRGHGQKAVSDKTPVFVPWYEIEIYSKAEVPDPARLWREMDSYERSLWYRHGCTLAQIAWYHEKRREYLTQAMMAAEFPTDDVEAFANSGSPVFAPEAVERLRVAGQAPEIPRQQWERAVGPASAAELAEMAADPRGTLRVWHTPDRAGRTVESRYVVGVDIGGRSASADYSAIVVIDALHGPNLVPAIAAQWRGHCDHDLLAKRAAAMARVWDDALLVVESNTWETSLPDSSLTLLDALADSYPNLYRRHVYDQSGGPSATGTRVGFHTNRQTKMLVINHLIALVRDCAYREPDLDAIAELTQYEYKPNGSLGAKDGRHDDLVMARAIALYVASREALQPPTSDAVTSCRRRRRARW